MSSVVEPLNPCQKILNQRLLAAHSLSHTELESLWDEITTTTTEKSSSILSLHDALVSCNAQLQYLGLEITAVVVNWPTKDTSSNSNCTKAQQPRSSQLHSQQERYYALVNKFPDEISKKVFQSIFFQPIQQQAYVMAVFQKLVEGYNNNCNPQKKSRSSTKKKKNATNMDDNDNNNDDDNDDENDNNNNNDTVGVTRAILLNLRISMKDKSLTLSATEDCLEKLLEEKWLIEHHQYPHQHPPASSCALSLDSTSNENGGGTLSQSKSRRRSSTNATIIQFGPRTFCELSYYLIEEFGMNPEDMPQRIILQ